MYKDEMQMIDGICRYCGQGVMVKAMDRRDADLKAADECSCGKAVAMKMYHKAEARLEELIGDAAVAEGYAQVSSEQRVFAFNMLEMVCNEHAGAITVNIYDSVIRIAAAGEGKVKLSRTRKVQKEFKV